jgi:hypothetical protein
VQFHLHRPQDTNLLFASSGDTEGYFQPIEAFVEGHGYSMLQATEKGASRYKTYTDRMPGLLPVYAPLYSVAGKQLGRSAFILFQLFASCLSVLALGAIAQMLFRSVALQITVMLLYSISAFISLLDHYGLSDSLSISFFIFSLYFFLKFYYASAGEPSLPAVRKPVLPFSQIPVFQLFLSGWFIPLQTAYSDIFPEQTRLLMDKVIPMTGGDFQPWVKGSEGEFLFRGLTSENLHRKVSINESPYSPNDFTPEFTFDSLLQLRTYFYLASDHPDNTLSEEKREIYKALTIQSGQKYIDSFRKHYPFRYYFLSYAEMTIKFLFVKNLSRFPFPIYSEMSLLHIFLKAGSIVLYNLIVLFGLIGFIQTAITHQRLPFLMVGLVIPYILLITVYYFCREHRYFAMVYPLFVIFAGYALLQTLTLLRRRFSFLRLRTT